jgi:protein required for attachment to host cells
MALPNQALVLVIDGRKMLFFRNHGDETQIDLRTEKHDEREDAYDRDMKTDAPGNAATGMKGGGDTHRPAYSETDYHQQEEDKWVKDAADQLRRRALANNFEALAIVAPPKALGVLRQALHKEVERRVVLTLNKEMSGRPVPDIEALFAGEQAQPG